MLPDEAPQVTRANLCLLNEQQDLSDGPMLGNMLQALSHLALIRKHPLSTAAG